MSTAFPAEMPKKDKKRKTYQIYNQNPLLMDGYRGTLGVKTGYTTMAGATYVGAVERGGNTYIVTMMGLAEPTEGAAERLFNWTFEHSGDLRPLGNLVPTLNEPNHAITPAAAAPAANSTTVEPGSAGLNLNWVALGLLAVCGLSAVLLVNRRSRQRSPALPPIR